MPYRKTPLVSGEIYHVFNRSIARQPIFFKEKDCQRALDILNYYRFADLPLRFSHYNRLPTDQKQRFLEKHVASAIPIVEIYAYCLMPNHFHLLIKPLTPEALSTYMRKVQNSYSKYFNTKYERTGSLFQFMFKAVHIATEEQLLHISRYIHLNPVTAYLIEIDQLAAYQWCSFCVYVTERKDPIITSENILSNFPSKEAYRKFVFDQVDYQRELDRMKHLILE